MILEFINGDQINVNSIFGGPKLINGVMRDTLRIEINPNEYTFDQLKSFFKDNPNTSKLYSYSESKDDNGDIINVKNEIGEGYKIFVSISDEERHIQQVPGKLVPARTEEVYIVTIAQQTYEEYMLKNNSSIE